MCIYLYASRLSVFYQCRSRHGYFLWWIDTENHLGKDKHKEDLKETRQKINDLALSLPEKYVNKGDFENLVKIVHHRFDRIEEKLDRLQK